MKEIYDYYIENTTVTFHTKKIDIEGLKKQILDVPEKYVSFLIKAGTSFCGFCYLSSFNIRQAYDRTAEITLYLKPDFTQKNIGQKVISFLEERAQENNISVIVAKITSENKASIRLFEKMKYEQCAHFKQVGEKFGRILDVFCYQKIL